MKTTKKVKTAKKETGTKGTNTKGTNTKGTNTKGTNTKGTNTKGTVFSIFRPFVLESDGDASQPSISEKMLNDLESSCRHCEGSGDKVAIGKARQKRDRWRRLMAASEEKMEVVYDRSMLEAEDRINFLLARAERHSGPHAALSVLLGQLLSGLGQLAEQGDEMVAQILASSLHEAVHNFEVLADRKPELFRQWARKCAAIPGMISRKGERSKDNQELLEKLEQGVDSPFDILPSNKTGKTWSSKTPSNSLTLNLVRYIERERRLYRLYHLEKPETFPCPEWLHEAARLKDFSIDTWEEWAAVGWIILKEESDRAPTFRAHLVRILNARKTRQDPYFGGTVKGVGIEDHDMKETIFRAFKAVAGGHRKRLGRS